MVLRQSAVYLVAKAIPGIVNFLSTLLFSRLVSPDDYGVFATVFAGVMIANTGTQAWIRASLVRHYADYAQDPGRLISTVQWLDRFSNALAVVIGLVGLFFFHGADRGYWMAGIVLFALVSSQEIGLEFERARMLSRQFAVNSSLRSLLRLAVTVLLLKMGWGVWGLLIGAGASALGPNVYAWFTTWRHYPAKLDLNVLRALTSYGLPLLGVYLLDSVIGQFSRIMLTSYRGVEATGHYSMVLDTLKQVVQIALLGVNLAVFPLALKRYKEDDLEGTHQVLRKGISFSLALSLPLAIAFAAAPHETAFVFGKSFRGAAPEMMPMISFAMLLAGLKRFYFDLSFQFGYRTVQQLMINVIAAAVSLGLNAVLIPALGMAGVAWATLVTYVVAVALSVWKGRKVFALPWPGRETAYIFIASLGMIAGLRFGGRSGPLTSLVLGAFVYSVILLVFDFLKLRTKIARRLKMAGSS